MYFYLSEPIYNVHFNMRYPVWSWVGHSGCRSRLYYWRAWIMGSASVIVERPRQMQSNCALEPETQWKIC